MRVMGPIVNRNKISGTILGAGEGVRMEYWGSECTVLGFKVLGSQGKSWKDNFYARL